MDVGAMRETCDYEPYSTETEKYRTVSSKGRNESKQHSLVPDSGFFSILVHVGYYSLDTLHTLSFTVRVVLVYLNLGTVLLYSSFQPTFLPSSGQEQEEMELKSLLIGGSMSKE